MKKYKVFTVYDGKNGCNQSVICKARSNMKEDSGAGIQRVDKVVNFTSELLSIIAGIVAILEALPH